MEKELREVKLKNGIKVKPGDVIFITMSPNNLDTIARGRFIEMTKDGNIKLYVIFMGYVILHTISLCNITWN